MRLKRLEMLGFKSFRDKVILDFSKGISAIVGLNEVIMEEKGVSKLVPVSLD